MRVAITGATGLIGSHVAAGLIARGDDIVPVSRSDGNVHGVPTVRWDPVHEEFPAAALDGVDAVVNLAGASVADGRWTSARKAVIRDSRVGITTRIARALAGGSGPRVLVNGSASGYYGDRGDEVLDESSAAATGDFLAETARLWEAAAREAGRHGVRVAISRTGMVMASDGGVVPRLARLARLGLAGPIAGGRQWVPWVCIDDVVGMILCALDHEEWEGPFNTVGPAPLRQADVARAFGRAVRRPAVVPTPRIAIALALGEARVLVTDSQRCVPRAAAARGYTWAQPDIDGCLRAAIPAGA
jgi:uncharacterized protein